MVGKHNLKNQGIRKALEVDQAMNAQGDETRENDDPIPGEVGSDLDEDHLSKSEHDTDTESEADEDDDNQAVRASASSDKSNVYVAESTNLEWSKSAPGTRRSCVTHAPGPQGAAKYAKEILQAFEIFFDEDLLKLLVENTNKYIEKVKCNFERSQDARDVSDSEMKAFLGVLIGMGVQQEGHASYTDIFNDANFSSDFFSTTMSSVRFMFILRCLRFDDTDTRMAYVTTDKLGPIRYLFDDIVTKCKKFYTTSEYVTIDEQLVAFRGKCGFKQCITSKQNKYGIKIFSMCDACTFYNSNMEVYLGKNYPEAAQNDDLAKSVVLRLIEPIRKTSRNLTTDKWFTSVSLADSLLHEHKVTLVGVVRSSNAEIPREFRADKSRAVKSSLFGFVTDKTLVSYVPKKRKSVTLLSTLHNNGKIDSETGQDAKPEILTFYESTKGAVEVNGKLCAIYSVARRTKRWPLAVFFHLLNVCCINAQVKTSRTKFVYIS